MRRMSHDLPGATQRIAKHSEAYHAAIDEVREGWRDDKSRAFLQRHTTEIRPTIGQLVSAMTQTTALFEEISKRLRDPDEHQ